MFSLIKSLQDQENNPKAPENGIKYQQYELVVESTDCKVLIPLRECGNFEAHMENESDNISRKGLRTLLRKFRGIIENN